MALVTVKKSNRVIEIDESQLKGYLARGYDQINGSNEVVKHATGGKSVSIGEYNKLLAEVKELREQGSNEEVEKLQEEITTLKEKAKEFAEKGKALQEENAKLKQQLKK